MEPIPGVGPEHIRYGSPDRENPRRCPGEGDAPGTAEGAARPRCSAWSCWSRSRSAACCGSTASSAPPATSQGTSTMSDRTLTATGSTAPAGGRAAAATPGGPTPAGQTPDVAEIHAHDAPPPPGPRPVAAGAGRRWRLAADGPAPRRTGRRRPSRPPARDHPRANDQHARPAAPAGASAPPVRVAPPAITTILNGNLTTIVTAILNRW